MTLGRRRADSGGFPGEGAGTVSACPAKLAVGDTCDRRQGEEPRWRRLPYSAGLGSQGSALLNKSEETAGTSPSPQLQLGVPRPPPRLCGVWGNQMARSWVRDSSIYTAHAGLGRAGPTPSGRPFPRRPCRAGAAARLSRRVPETEARPRASAAGPAARSGVFVSSRWRAARERASRRAGGGGGAGRQAGRKAASRAAAARRGLCDARLARHLPAAKGLRSGPRH